MTTYAASRLAAVKPSPSAMVSEAAKRARDAGRDVIDLGLGEPDFGTPEHVVDAAHVAARSGQTKYPPTAGTAELKAAVAQKLARDNRLSFGADEIIVSNGAKQVIFNALMASMEPGAEVVLAAPYFASYKDMVLINGGVPVVVECDPANGFRLTPNALAAAISPKTRWLFLNMPSNPAGAVYEDDDLTALGAVLADHPQTLIMSDEIYEHILFDGRRFTSFAAACPALAERVLTVNVSKAYAMTGWRIGYGAGPKELIAASRFSPDLVVDRVARIPGLNLDAPGGAFYGFIDCAACIGGATATGGAIADDVAFAQFLLDEASVACVPGAAYGLSPFFRISTAAADDVLATALDRIASAVATLTPSQTETAL